MRKLLWFCVFATSPVLLNAQTELRAEIEKLLPPIESRVDIMGVVYHERFQELSKKMQMALATNKEWFLSYIKQNAKPGEPLPYDERIGMTKSEYAEFLSLGEKREMRKFGSAELKITTNAETFRFNCPRDLPDLDGVKINLRDMSITTPFGVITNPTPDASENGGLIGPFSGYRWNFEKDDQDLKSVTTTSFVIGQAKKSGRNFIYYKGGIMKSNNAISNATVLIFYDKPKP